MMAQPFRTSTGSRDTLDSAPQKSYFEEVQREAPWLASDGSMATPSRVPPLTDDERAALMTEVRRTGETAASRRLGVPRSTMARALARLKIQTGSVLLIRHGLASTRPSSNEPSSPEAA